MTPTIATAPNERKGLAFRVHRRYCARMTEIDTEAVRIEVSRGGALRLTFTAEALAVAAVYSGTQELEWDDVAGRVLVADVRRWLARHARADSSSAELALRVAAAVASVYLEEREARPAAAQC
jgi:hypothetical protein